VGRSLWLDHEQVDGRAGDLGNTASGAGSSTRGIQDAKEADRSTRGIAHDLNNLIHVILGYCELVMREGVPASSSGKLERIREAGERAAVLTRQLLMRKQRLE
jgi:signal transduction histidine kinase